MSQAQPIKQYRLSREKLEGSGEKLGTAYRLNSGEIVCVSASQTDAPPASGQVPTTSPG